MNTNRSKKIVLLYALLLLGFAIFLSAMLSASVKHRKIPAIYISDSTTSQRANIISADGFNIATTKKLYKAVINTKNIDPQKKELFVKLFSIYSNINENEILNKIESKYGSVVLSYNIGPKEAKQLKSLSYELLRMKILVEHEDENGNSFLHGLNILESGEKRLYPYNNLLTPLIGYPHKIEEEGYTKAVGIKGIEKYYEKDLAAQQHGYKKGMRDVNNYIIYNKKSFVKNQIDGLNVQLNIPLSLQIRVEKMLDTFKTTLDAKEVISVVMESHTGKILSIASSNRFDPNNIRRVDYPSLRSSAIEYSFEPGSVVKPVAFALLLDAGLVNPYDLVNGHNGRYKLKNKVITDEHEFAWLSAENVIVHSSNIGIAQLVQKLGGYEFHEGLKKFGFSEKSGIDLPYDKQGSIPSAQKLNHEIFKATASYGYGIKANLVQVTKAYNVFNNNGKMLVPLVTMQLIDQNSQAIFLEYEEPIQVIKPSTAERMKQILIKTVKDGTGKAAYIPGLQIGGKTGTAHIAEKGKYVKKYNSSFVGFADDHANGYTIGVTVIEPKTQHFASLTAVPVFKQIVEILIKEGYLTPAITQDK